MPQQEIGAEWMLAIKTKADAPDTGTVDEPAIGNGVLATELFTNKISHETKIRLEILP